VGWFQPEREALAVLQIERFEVWSKIVVLGVMLGLLRWVELLSVTAVVLLLVAPYSIYIFGVRRPAAVLLVGVLLTGFLASLVTTVRSDLESGAELAGILLVLFPLATVPVLLTAVILSALIRRWKSSTRTSRTSADDSETRPTT